MFPGCITAMLCPSCWTPGAVGFGLVKAIYWLWAVVVPVLAAPSAMAEVIISEFAAAGGGLRDEDGDSPDWIELYHSGEADVSLSEWALTDDEDHEQLWRFPNVIIRPGQYLVVFASGKHRVSANSRIPHTDFKLAKTSGYLALIRPDGTIASEFEHYPEQAHGTSFGMPNVREPNRTGHFADVTPGTGNGRALAGLVAAPKFSTERGIFDQPQRLELTCENSDAEIRYTTDGSVPTATEGTRYAKPISISKTSCIRARAFRPGWIPSKTVTHTAIFPKSVLGQTGKGLPQAARWGVRGPDWEMDPRIVRHKNPESRVTTSDLLTLPSVSLVLPFDDLWGQNGIYIYGEGDERAASAEYLDPDGDGTSQIDCSVQVVGGTSVSRWRTNVLSMRLKFQRAYGAGEWEFSPFDDYGAAESFETLVLDARSNYAWTYAGPMNADQQRERALYVRDQLTADLQRAAGGYAPRGRPVHFYLNGLYWGVYVLHERPDEHFAAHYLGGKSEDYDVVKHSLFETVHGGSSSFPSLIELVGQDLSINRNYEAVLELLDLDDFINYMLVNFYLGNRDWAHHNWYATRNRQNPDGNGKWRFHSWDAEKVLLDLEENVTERASRGSPTQIHHMLRRNDRYRFAFADRAWTLLSDDGLLTPARTTAFFRGHTNRVSRAVTAVSARWGDSVRRGFFSRPFTRGGEWIAERNRVLNHYLPRRTSVVIRQLLASDLYYTVPPPVFSHSDGPLEDAVALIISHRQNDAKIYYTLDGTDPSELAASKPDDSAIPLVTADTIRRAMVPVDNRLEQSQPDWRQLAFDDRSWKSGAGGAGYETKSGYEQFLAPNLSFEDLLYGRRSSLYMRVPFSVEDPDAIRRLRLSVQCDDGFVAYLNGTEIARFNVSGTPPRWNQTARRDGTDSQAVVFRNFTVPITSRTLREGDNMLAVHGFNDEIDSSDMLLNVLLDGLNETTFLGTASEHASLYKTPIEVAERVTVKARAFHAGSWSALTEAEFYPGAELAAEGNLAISTIHYHPSALESQDRHAGILDRSDSNSWSFPMSAVAQST